MRGYVRGCARRYVRRDARVCLLPPVFVTVIPTLIASPTKQAPMSSTEGMSSWGGSRWAMTGTWYEPPSVSTRMTSAKSPGEEWIGEGDR